jgi:hypothetical protein
MQATILQTLVDLSKRYTKGSESLADAEEKPRTKREEPGIYWWNTLLWMTRGIRANGTSPAVACLCLQATRDE